MRKKVFFISILAVCAGAIHPFAQGRPSITAADYARAEKMLSANVTPLVYRSAVRANWLPDTGAASSGDGCWYRVGTECGVEAVRAAPSTGSNAPGSLPQCAAAEGRGGRGGRAGQAAG